MSATILTGIPARWTAGDTISFYEPGGCYPPAAWTNTLWMALQGSTATPKSFVATTSGTSYLFSISAVQSATLAPGTWRYSEIVTGGSSEVYTVREGDLIVLPNVQVPATQTDAQATVALYQGVLQKLAASTNSSVNFNGQSYTKSSVKDYQEQLTFWQARVIQEQMAIDIARGKCVDPYRIQTRFTPQVGPPYPFGFPPFSSQ